MSFPNCFLDSFSHYTTNDLYGLGNGMKWSGVYGVSTQTIVYISPGTGLFGNSLHLAGPTNPVGIYKIFNNVTTWVVGFRYRTTSVANGPQFLIVLFDSGTQQIQFGVNTNGTLFVNRAGTAVTGGISTNAIIANTWYYIEMMVTISASISANTWQVNVNGVQWLNVTAGQSSKNTSNITANQLVLGYGSTGPGMTADFCDFYCDGGGSVNGGAFWGDTKIECHWPISVGTYSTWTPNNSLAVGCINDETPNGDLNFLSDNNPTDKSTFLFQPLGSTPSSIMCAQLVYDIRKNDAGTRQVADYCYSGLTAATGVVVNPGNTYQMYTNVLSQDPHTAASWTANGLNSAEFGVEVIS